MVFIQPVVVDDAVATNRPVAAEVRVAERVREEPRWTGWTGMMLAQSAIDQRSPFGAGAPDKNDIRPDFVPPNTPAGNVPAPSNPSGPISDPTSTKIPPAPNTTTAGRPDAGPPPVNG